MIGDQQKEEIIPIAFAERRTGKQKNRAADNNRNESENQMPGAHTTLSGLCMLHQPAVQQPEEHSENFCDGHHDFVLSAHHTDHFYILRAVHRTGLLGKKLFHQRRDCINDKNQAERPQKMPEYLFLFGNCPRLNTRIHKGLFKQSFAEQSDLLCHTVPPILHELILQYFSCIVF